MSEISIADKRCTTAKARLSFPALGEPKSFRGQEAKYGATFLFDKSIDLAAPVVNKKGKKISEGLETVLMVAAREKWGAKADAIVEKIKRNGKGWPIRDGDTDKPDMEGYENMNFVSTNAKKDKPPGLVDRERNRIEADALYAGCYARATLVAYAYDNEFGKGLGFSLQNVQKIGEGKKFGGKKAAEEDFDEIEDQSDDPENYEEQDELLR